MPQNLPWNLILVTTVVTLLVVIGAVFTGPFATAVAWLQHFIISYFGWFYVLAVVSFLVFVLWLMLGQFGGVRLGRDEDRPDYNFSTWFAMLFSAGMGIGLIFYSVAEPISHFAHPPRAAPETPQAANDAMVITFFHWGLHAWAVYVVMGLALAYSAYRHDLPLTIRSALYSVLGERVHGPLGSSVDMLAVFGTVFGLATSLGLGAMQFNAGLAHLGLAGMSVDNQVILIAVITLAATASAASGLNNGIRRLSQVNMVLALLLLVTVFLAGPTVFLLSSYVQNIGSYAASILELSFNTDVYIGLEWQEAWTMFYWGWWISWSPFVGMFIARISRGRTIREFIAGVLLAPTLTIFFWMVVFGNTAIHLELAGAGGLVEAVHTDIATVIFVLFEHLPLSGVTSLITIAVIAIFFVTSADSGSLVINFLISGGEPNPPMHRRGLGAIMIGAVAAVLLLSGGLGALQTAAIITAAPFSIVMLLICYALVKSLRAEQSLRPVAEGQAPTAAGAEGSAATGLAPLAGVTPPGGYTGARPVTLAVAERQEDWRGRLKTIIWGYDRYTKRAAERRAAAMPQIQSFLEGTVLPAFEQLKAELEGYGRQVNLTTDTEWATLTVSREGGQEFNFTVRSVVREPLTFALTDLTPAEDVNPRAEISLPTGRLGLMPLEECTGQRIIDEFVSAYARWMGW